MSRRVRPPDPAAGPKTLADLPEPERELRVLLGELVAHPAAASVGHEVAARNASRPLVVTTLAPGWGRAGRPEVVSIAVRGSPPRALLIVDMSYQTAWLLYGGHFARVAARRTTRTARSAALSKLEHAWAIIEAFLASRARR